MGRLAGRVAIGSAVAFALVYIGDFAVWKVRLAHGGGMGQVKVSQMMVAPLKGNKEEYYPDGSAIVNCSRSLFPQVGGGACWWVERHRVVFEQ